MKTNGSIRARRAGWRISRVGAPGRRRVALSPLAMLAPKRVYQAIGRRRLSVASTTLRSCPWLHEAFSVRWGRVYLPRGMADGST
jgi:hypothetical protein